MNLRMLLTTTLTLALPLLPGAAAEGDDGPDDPLGCAQLLLDDRYYPMWWENATTAQTYASDAAFHVVRGTHAPQNATNLSEVWNHTLPDDPFPAPPHLDLTGKMDATVDAEQHAVGNASASLDCIDRALRLADTLNDTSIEVGRILAEATDPYENATSEIVAMEKEIECKISTALFPPPPDCPAEENETRSVRP